MLVRDAMTSKVEWISPDLTLREVAAKLRDCDIGCLPVGENDRLVGMITDRDICYRGVADGTDPNTATARTVMSRGITYCLDDEDIEEAARLMETKGIHHLAVLNRDKRLVGILTLGDLALRGPSSLFPDLVRIASRDAARHHQSSSVH